FLASKAVLPDWVERTNALAKTHSELLSSSMAGNAPVFLASKAVLPDWLERTNALAKKYSEILSSSMAGSALGNALWKSQLTASERYGKLLSDNFATRIFTQQLALEQDKVKNIKEAHASISNYLNRTSVEELNSIVNIVHDYTGTAKGAAYIAENSSHFNKVDSDAIAKFQDFKNKNKYVRKFRELPWGVQLIICCIFTSVIIPMLTDFIKAEILKTLNTPSELIMKNPSINVYVRELNDTRKGILDWETLKDFRVITGNDINLREKPSMQGEVIGLLEKYSIVLVLDKSDRKWLYVKVSVNNEEIYGWINRTYTKPLRKN
uniref:SH3 domain-containing protein n=1 Tax=uncultured Cedecea sp. TaxID=988762 RepID=UPI00261090A0